MLGPEQQELVNLILTGRNVFYTGAAGTGKSLVLRTAVEKLRARMLHVEVVAPTGKAALAVNGMTTWSFAGWTPSAHARPLEILRNWSLSKKNVFRLARTDVLVIDEISMVENHHLERLSEIMKEARAYAARHQGSSHTQTIRDTPFGGCQIIATGDFFQLPPVTPFQFCMECGSPLLQKFHRGKTMFHRGETIYSCPEGHGTWSDSSKWAFQSEAWERAGFAHVELKQIYRQAGDPYFIKILDRVRSGALTHDDVMVLTDRNRKTQDLTNAVRLYPTRAEVARHNDKRLEELKTPPHDFFVRDSFFWNKQAHPDLKPLGEEEADGTLTSLRDHQYEPVLRLKVGMSVILLSNLTIKDGLVNGSQGVVVDFAPVNRAQLLSKKKAKGDTERAYISEIKNGELSQFAESFPDSGIPLPVVQFDNGAKQIIYPDCSVREMGNENAGTEDKRNRVIQDAGQFWMPREPSLLCRTQIPLAAGWAMSIHKAQGMSLGKVIVDLTRTFAEGQVYVALSRARSIDGLQVLGNPRGLFTRSEGNQEVRDFYQKHFQHKFPPQPSSDRRSLIPLLQISPRCRYIPG